VTLFAFHGAVTGDLLTLGARVIVHDNRAEMEWLVPHNSRVVAVTEQDLARRSPLPPLLLREHPGMATVRWPLRREDFVS
jgi:hypothetical protein